jgi:hypothetical protein
MVKRKVQPIIYKILRRKQQIEQHEPKKQWVAFRFTGRVPDSCFTSGTRHVTVKRHEHRVIWKSCWTSLCVELQLNQHHK